MPCKRDQYRSSPPGFSLTELIVVMGIITLLIGLLLPTVHYALKYGRKSRLQADMQTLSMGLEAYKTDFGDYPRFTNSNAALSGQWDWSSQRGAELLCRALVGPGPGVPANWTPGNPDNSGADGAGAGGDGGIPNQADPNAQLPGPGFRTRLSFDSAGNPVAQGKLWGPYIPADKFRIFTLSTLPGFNTIVVPANPTGAPNATSVMLDSEYHTILYFPANLTPVNISNIVPPGYVTSVSPIVGPSPSLYNFFDNSVIPPDPMNNPSTGAFLMSDFCKLLGNASASGYIELGETAASTAPYLVWMAGEDGKYGLDTTGRSDDVTNFDIPSKLRR